jgi:hypothetical protein
MSHLGLSWLIAAQVASFDPKATHVLDTVDHTGVLAEVFAVQETHAEALVFQTGVE